MSNTPTLTDRLALQRNRARASATGGPADFLHRLAIDEMQERLATVNRTFTAPAIVTGFPGLWSDLLPHARVVSDSDTLDLAAEGHDLIIHAMSLHWANDIVGQLIQSRRALKPDGLFLGVFPGGRSLSELRASLAEAEVAVTGGLSPRIAPMADIRDAGNLMQRAGFALPVADSVVQDVTYSDALGLMRDLRAMGEGNALSERHRTVPPRALFARTAQIYADHFGRDDRIPATFELLCLSGWAPDDSQSKPLAPGSARQRLADALGTDELPTGEPAKPRRV